MNLTRVSVMIGLILIPWLQIPLSEATNPAAKSFGTPYKIDVSTGDGLRGNNGLNYESGYNYGGGDGPRGGKGTPGENAFPGGDINVDLESHPTEKGKLKLSGKFRYPRSPKAEDFALDIEIKSEGYIELDAHAGKPGDGGDGGDGGQGDKGTSGADATRYSSGSDGGRGGTGGDGGDAGRAGDSASGGKIVVGVSEDQTELLMLIKENHRGSGKAFGGKGGKGGPGGPGGDGGSSYSWTETETYSSTDSQGRSTTETRTVFKSNPGGSTGPSGYDGDKGSDGTDTNPGPEGTYTIQVKGKSGQILQSVDQRYDLVLVDFKYENENQDGIFEPGEKVIVSKIRIKNSGKLPTPVNLKAQFFIKNNTWVNHDGINLFLPKVLQPGEEFVFENETLNFVIALPKEAHKGSPLVMTSEIKPGSKLLERPFENFELSKSFEIRFPIEVTPLIGVSSMAAGEKRKISWVVKNISKKDFGGLSDLKREIGLQLQQLAGGVDPKNIHFIGPDGKRIELDKMGWFREFGTLKAGESVIIEGIIETDQNAPTYEIIDLKGTLKLGSINSPSNKTVIQEQGLKITVAESYKKSKDSGLLLIVNNTTKREELLAWKKLAERLGLSLDVWDLSLFGYLALTKGLENKSLSEDFKNKTMILLNNTMRSVDQAEELPLDYVRRADFLKVASENGIRFYIVQPSEIFDASELLLPTGEKTKSHTSISAYLKALQEGRNTEKEAKKLGEIIEEIEHTGWRLIFKPKEKAFLNKIKNLLKKGKKLDPASRTFVVYHFERKILQQKFFGLLKQWKIGSIEVRRTLDEGINSIVAIDPVLGITEGRAEMITPEFILGRENELGLLMSLTFKEKLVLLERATRGLTPELNQKSLFQAIAFDLAEEQLALLKSKKNAGVTSKTLMRNLPNLNLLSQFKFPGGTPPQNFLEDIADLVARVQNLAASSTSWWEWITPGRRYPKVAHVVESALWDWVKSIYKNSESWNAFKTRTTEIKKEFLSTSGINKKAIQTHPTQNGLNQTLSRLYGGSQGPVHVRNTEDLFSVYETNEKIQEQEDFKKVKDAADARDKNLDARINNNLLMIKECMGKTLEK